MITSFGPLFQIYNKSSTEGWVWYICYYHSEIAAITYDYYILLLPYLWYEYNVLCLIIFAAIDGDSDSGVQNLGPNVTLITLNSEGNLSCYVLLKKL